MPNPVSRGLAVIVLFTTLSAAPAQAIVVFDPSNYSQNVLTAARTLQQINNQVKSLQNEAQTLVHQAKNLSKVGFPEIGAITSRLQQIDQLMAKAEGIEFRIDKLDAQFAKLFPNDFKSALKLDEQVLAARTRLDTELAAYRHSMTVQANVIENVQADMAVLNDLSARSQGAEGALQVGQATNQLLAFSTKQQLQIQSLLAAHFRAEAFEQARRLQAETDARAAAVKFLGTGEAYTPK